MSFNTESTEGLNIANEERNGSPKIVLSGHFTSKYVSPFRDQMQELLHNPPTKIVVNMADLEFIDSIGIGVLIFFHNNLRGKGCEMVIEQPSQSVIEIFQLTSLDKVFQII